MLLIYEGILTVPLHGIKVPTTLFPNSWERQNYPVKLDWPVPVLIVIDICGNMDLDLNSSRTQILMSEKWTKFEEKLSFEILSSVAQSVESDYWNRLKDILKTTSKNKIFSECLGRVTKGTNY